MKINRGLREKKIELQIKIKITRTKAPKGDD